MSQILALFVLLFSFTIDSTRIFSNLIIGCIRELDVFVLAVIWPKWPSLSGAAGRLTRGRRVFFVLVHFFKLFFMFFLSFIFYLDISRKPVNSWSHDRGYGRSPIRLCPFHWSRTGIGQRFARRLVGRMEWITPISNLSYCSFGVSLSNYTKLIGNILSLK